VGGRHDHVPTGAGFIDWAIVLDVWSRRIVGGAIGELDELALFTYIEGWYNPRRRHSALGRVSPIEFERSQAQHQSPMLINAVAAPEPACD
jgi:transposase InsO family protein